MLWIRTILVITMGSIFLAACSSTPSNQESKPAPTSTASSPTAQTTPVASESEAKKLALAVKMLESNSIYFDYDEFTIKPEYHTVLQQDSVTLKSVPTAKFRLEGNADERGSTEYNLALGQKRAETVKRALSLIGVPDSQLESVSFGKEKPHATCHEEKCWAKNRRVDITKTNSQMH